MRTFRVIVVSFVVAAVLGTVMVEGGVFLAAQAISVAHRHDRSPGIGAVAGGLTEGAVTLLPVLCGLTGVLAVQLWRVRKR